MKLLSIKRLGANTKLTAPSQITKKLSLLLSLLFSIIITTAQTQVTVLSTSGSGALGINYSNIGNAFAAINAGGIHTGAVTIKVNGNTIETTPAVLNASGAGACSYTNILIQPTTDAISITGNFTTPGRGIIELNGADNITINGDNDLTAGINKNLTLTFSTAQGISQSLIRLVTSTLPMDCNAVTIKNCMIKGNVINGNSASIISSTSAAALSFGIIVAGGGSTTSATAAPTALVTTGVALITPASVANNFVVDNCTINNVGVGIDFFGNTPASSNIFTITNNIIGTAGSTTNFPGGPTSTVYFKGIFYRGSKAATITGNTIQGICSYFISGTTPNIVSAIECNSTFNNGGGQFNISNNTINGIWSNNAAATNTTQIARGIVMLGSAATTTIICNKNTITNIKSNTVSNATNTAACAIDLGCSTNASWMAISNNTIDDIFTTKPWGSTGIAIATGGNNANIYNNRISNIAESAGGTAINTMAIGIKLSAGLNHKVYHNSILLRNNYGNFQHISAGIAGLITTANAAIDIRNNIIANYSSTITNTTAIDAAIILNAALVSTNKYTLNHNAYFGPIGTTTNYLAYLYNTTTFSNANTSNSYSYANFNELATTPATNFRAFSNTLNTTANDNASIAIPLIGTRPFNATNDLHISSSFANNTSGTRLESKGTTGLAVVGAGLLQDFEGDNRNGPTGSTNGGATAPDLGADEFDGKQFNTGCTGTPAGGTIAAAGVNIYCTTSVPANRAFTLTGHTDNIENIVVQWQASTTSAGSGFADIANANNATFTTGTAPTQTTWYRAAVICTKSGITTYQTIPAFTQLTNKKIWMGGNSNWSIASNWTCGLPTSTDDIIIDNGNPIMDINFTVGGKLTISGTASLTVQPNTMLAISNTGIADFGGKLVTFKSTSTGTAMLGKISGTLINATNVTIERYIPAHTQRAWRLLSIPTYGNAQTIRQAWQEGNANPNALQNNNAFGTQITGIGTNAQAVGNGFDNNTTTASISYFNNGMWNNITNTNAPIETKAGYFIYIRGNRSIGINSQATATNTTATLRTNGTIYQGNQTYPTIDRNSFGLIGNLYPCTIDFTKMVKTGGVSNVYYVWDAKKLSGTSLGSYQTFSATNGYECILPGGSYIMGNVYKEIQSGQAFMVSTSSTAGTITLTEDCKVASNSNAGLRPTTPNNELVQLKTRLYKITNNQANIVDANTVVFNNTYSNDIGTEDAIKINNTAENFGIQKAATSLIIEGRKIIAENDTIAYTLSNLKPSTYTLEIIASNVYSDGTTAFIEDSYTGIATPIQLQSSTSINFDVNSTPASCASNRFKVVFKKTTAQPSSNNNTISIITNPIQQHTANLRFTNMQMGNYQISLVDNKGAILFTTQQMHTGGNNIYPIKIANTIKNGIYHLQIITTQKNQQTLPIVIGNSL